MLLKVAVKPETTVQDCVLLDIFTGSSNVHFLVE